MKYYSTLFFLVVLMQSVYADILEHRIVAGSEKDIMLVQYYKIKGSNLEIGKNIAQIAKDMHISVNPVSDKYRNELRYRYFKENYHIHYERMKGLANGFGSNISDYSKDYSTLLDFPT